LAIDFSRIYPVTPNSPFFTPGGKGNREFREIVSNTTTRAKSRSGFLEGNRFVFVFLNLSRPVFLQKQAIFCIFTIFLLQKHQFASAQIFIDQKVTSENLCTFCALVRNFAQKNLCILS